jgi:hypothetical protein
VVDKTESKNGFSVRAYQGDMKTLLAFNFADPAKIKGLAGFTIACKPGAREEFFLFNFFSFKNPELHAQAANHGEKESINAPLHKFRWVHIPGQNHQGLDPFRGDYRYTVTPRYFDGNERLLPIDPGLSVSVTLPVMPFKKAKLRLGFARGFTQSQAFNNHFDKTKPFQPKGSSLLFDTSAQAGISPTGQPYSYADQYRWSGFTAREAIFELLAELKADQSLSLDMFAYDFKEPDMASAVIELARGDRLRLILDDAGLHHNDTGKLAEDKLEAQIRTATPPGKLCIKRGNFKRYAHHKVMILKRNGVPTKVLTGSTNFSVTGIYVNSNHILLFNDAAVAKQYGQVFTAAWDADVSRNCLIDAGLANKRIPLAASCGVKGDVSQTPSNQPFVGNRLGEIVARIDQEPGKSKGNVFFAVMELHNGTSPVWERLNTLHADTSLFSYGISDSTEGIVLYNVNSPTGILATGKPANTKLPPPFSQIKGIGIGHQIHHKFVICGFNGDDPVVYCGSSNLATGGETDNGDNLLAIRDADVVTAFTIEAVGLVDHFHFLDAHSNQGTPATPAPAQPHSAASAEGIHLSTSDFWAQKYFKPNDLHNLDRLLFA